MKAFSLLSPQDQMDVAIAISQQVIFLVSALVLLGSMLLLISERTYASLGYGLLLIWTLTCTSCFIGDLQGAQRISVIWVLGVIAWSLSPPLTETITKYLHCIYIRHRWNKLTKAWMSGSSIDGK